MSGLTGAGSQFALTCDRETGLRLAGVPLVERIPDGSGRAAYLPAAGADLDFLLSAAYGSRHGPRGRDGGLKAVARALAKGDIALAKISAALLRLPPLADSHAAERLARAQRLLKGNPDWADEPRDARGRWTTGGGGTALLVSDRYQPAQEAPFLEPPIENPLAEPPVEDPWEGPRLDPAPFVDPPEGKRPPVPLYNPYPNDPECARQWKDAYDFCDRLMKDGKLGKPGYRRLGKTLEECVLGQVTERCGGDPVDRDNTKPKWKPRLIA